MQQLADSPTFIAFQQTVSGSVVDLIADTEVSVFNPRPEDAYNLNGHTLTIDKMTDTRLTNLFRGAGTVIIKSGEARPSWWDSNSYRAAAIALWAGGGGRVLLDPGRYPSESSYANPIPVSNVRLEGTGMPRYAAGFSTLEQATILEGPVVFHSNDGAGNALGDDVVVRNLGIDSGDVVATAAGADLEGMTFANIGELADGTIPLRSGILIENVRILGRAAATPAHCLLIEQAQSPIVRNVETVYNENGIVLKTRGGLVDGARMRGHATNCWIDKSDVYSISQNNTWRNLRMGSITGRDSFGGRIQCGSADSVGHRVENVIGEVLTAVVSLEAGAYNLTDILLANIGGDDIRFYGIVGSLDPVTPGTFSRLAINGARLNNVTDVADGTYGNALSLGAGIDTVTVTGFQSVNTDGDGIRNSATNVRVAAAVTVNPGPGRYGLNGIAGDLTAAAFSGTSNGAVTVL